MARLAVFVLAGLCVVTLLLNQVTARAVDKAELLQKVDELRQAIEEADLLPAGEDEANEEEVDLPFNNDPIGEVARRNLCASLRARHTIPQCRKFGRR
ncbi:uncharacterized protein LOC118426064 isoform X2 [Branchiostoma floridae]|uniref:Uncharacterized protein LOC118426064 isoform X2 n=1 Tax=Branchiostoma floridae TaxID=7739 RepID=A0A9J7LXQ2_BRAFL|nr:uncharacterized protein LOC118426064 isoform X2 [Branchiostoma floridae]